MMDRPSPVMSKTTLSQSLLQMKFMKRSLDKRVQAEKEKEEKEIFSHGITEAMREGDKFISMPSYIHCKNLIVGRFSYNGMNPEVERMMNLEKIHRASKSSGEMEKDIADEEMAVVALANKMNKNVTLNCAIDNGQVTAECESDNDGTDEEWEGILKSVNVKTKRS